MSETIDTQPLPDAEAPSASERAAQTATMVKLSRVRLVCEGSARDAEVYLDDVLVRGCLHASLTADPNGRGVDRFMVLTLKILTTDAEITGPAVVVAEALTLDELRAQREAAQQETLREAYRLVHEDRLRLSRLDREDDAAEHALARVPTDAEGAE